MAGINPAMTNPSQKRSILQSFFLSQTLRMTPSRGASRRNLHRLAKRQVDALATEQRMLAIGQRRNAVEEQP